MKQVFIIRTQVKKNKNQMDQRLRKVNKKIVNSTFQIDRLMSQFTNQTKPFQSTSSNKYESAHKKQLVQYPQFQFGTPPTKLSMVNTNTSLNPQENRPKYAYAGTSPNAAQITDINTQDRVSKYKHDESSLQKKRGKPVDEKSPQTKFAIGDNLYPTSISVLRSDRKYLYKKEKGQVNNKNLLDVDHNILLENCYKKKPLSESSKPEQIYQYFYEFSKFFTKPLIKKFKNCLYFGDPLDAANSRGYKYTGFLYFFTDKIYYGQFQEQHKHGIGIEVHLKTKIVYRGIFNRGHKIGKFQVFDSDKIYYGHISKGKYHGQGKLTTPISIYTGQFWNNMRHGEGEQFFIKSGLKLKGRFQMDRFCNKKIQENSERTLKKERNSYSQEKNMQQLPKLANIFNFSFHDESEEEQRGFSRKKKSSGLFQKLKLPRKNQRNQQQEEVEDHPLPPPFRRIAFNNK